MSDYFNVTTNVGDAAIATAIANNSKLNITHIAFGDGNGSVPTPTKTRTSLVREVHRQAVTKYTMHPTIANYIVIETIIPSNIGGFWIREMGIIADNVLISHGSHAPFFKVADLDGVSEYRLKFTQNVRDGNVVEISLDESLIYASQAWVNENYIRRNELVDNLTTNDAKKPLSAKQGQILDESKLNNVLEGGDGVTDLEHAQLIAIGEDVGRVYPSGLTWYQVDRKLGLLVGMTGTPYVVTKEKNKANTIVRILTENDNAPSASRFATPRNIFGQTFDGSGDVGGTITASTGLVQASAFHFIDMGRNGLDRMSFYNFGATFNFIDSENGNVVARITHNGIDCNAATATKLATARTINGVAFDGTANISITDGTKANLSDFANLKSKTGYQKLPNGLILQWGEVTESISETDYKFFPIAFPNAAYAVIVQLNSNTVGGYASNYGTTVGVVDKTKFLLSVGGSFSAGGAGFYMAIGS